MVHGKQRDCPVALDLLKKPSKRENDIGACNKNCLYLPVLKACFKGFLCFQAFKEKAAWALGKWACQREFAVWHVGADRFKMCSWESARRSKWQKTSRSRIHGGHIGVEKAGRLDSAFSHVRHRTFADQAGCYRRSCLQMQPEIGEAKLAVCRSVVAYKTMGSVEHSCIRKFRFSCFHSEFR